MPDAEEPPGDIEDEEQYVAVPHRNDLDLGRTLVNQFIDEQLPQMAQRVRDIFRHKGAYARYKAFLAESEALDAWYEYERTATRNALVSCAREAGLAVQDDDDAA